jgi:hypothetical protein
MVELTQDAVKMPSSFIPLLLQFHRNALYLVTWLCFIYTIWSWTNVIMGSTWTITRKCGVVPQWTLDDQWRRGSQVAPTPQTQSNWNWSRIWTNLAWLARSISHAYVRVHKLPTTVVQLCWHEELPNVDTMIVICTAIWCLASISSRSSLSLLEKLESRLGTTNPWITNWEQEWYRVIYKKKNLETLKPKQNPLMA